MNKDLLYPCFDKWIGSIWFIADTHFGDVDEVIKASRSIFDDELVNKINKKVTKNDTLVLLGDVGDLSFVAKLKAGYKVLIMGNHDKGASNYKRQITPNISGIIDEFNKKSNVLTVSPNIIVNTISIDNKLFDEVYEGALMINEKIMLSHEPFDTPFTFNIHGHDHNGTDFKKHVLKYYDADMPVDDMSSNYLAVVKKDGLKRLNVCADWVGYSPISLKSIVKSGVLKDILDIHRITIDKATAKVKERKSVTQDVAKFDE